MSYIVSLLSTVYSASLVLQSTMSQRSLSSFFSSPVQPPPRAKREDVINALLYFRFKDRITGRKRQEAYNDAQKACATLFLSVPIATRCKSVAVAQQMGTRDREVRCLPHGFHAMQATVCARWAAHCPIIFCSWWNAYVPRGGGPLPPGPPPPLPWTPSPPPPPAQASPCPPPPPFC